MLGSRKRQRTMEERLLGGGAEGGGEKVGRLDLDAPPSAASIDAGAEGGIAAGGDDADDAEIDDGEHVWVRDHTGEYRRKDLGCGAESQDVAAAVAHAKRQLGGGGSGGDDSRSGFYGSGAGKGGAAAESPLEHRLLQAAKRRAAEDIAREKKDWQEFGRQEEAFRAADRRNGGGVAVSEARRTAKVVYVFAEEKDTGGRRRYIATTIDCLWRRLRANLDKGRRPSTGAGHFYEVIRKGSPCHLYFDIEFKKPLNPSVDGPAMTALFVDFVLEQLALWQPALAAKMSADDVIDLDASSGTKFSRHLIFRVPGAAFGSNLAMGAYVRQLMGVLRSRAAADSDAPLRGLFVRTEPEPEPELKHPDQDANPRPAGHTAEPGAEATTGSPGQASQGREEGQGAAAADLSQLEPFVDMGVYTKNRCFRLYLCSKFGNKDPARVLRYPAADATALPKPQKGTYLYSLVVNVPKDAVLLSFGEEPQPESEVDATSAAAWTSLGLSSPPLCGPSPPAGSGSAAAEGVTKGALPSPCPSLDSFVLSFARSRGDGRYTLAHCFSRCQLAQSTIQRLESDLKGACAAPMSGGARLRSWTLLGAGSPGARLSYAVEGDRYCERIGRPHKSNHVMMVVELGARVVYQSCWDPDCRGYHSPARTPPTRR